MSENSNIEWTDHTFNPWIGCTKVSPGCDNCYAEAMMDHRLKKVQWGPGAPRQRTSPANWKLPLAWNAAHAEFFAQHGRRQRVFCASLADVFDNAVPDSWRADLYDLIAATPNLDWLLLTKRIGNAWSMVPYSWKTRGGWPANVWLGASIVNQDEADRDIRKLVDLPAAVRFLSMEPLLGPVDLRFPTRLWGGDRCAHCCNGDRCDDPSHYERERCPHCRSTGMQKVLDWVIVGGESGPEARPMAPQWARSLRDQCAAAGVPFLFKQWGEWAPGTNVERCSGIVRTAKRLTTSWLFGKEYLAETEGHADDEPDLYRIGKREAGRALDGMQHDGFPEVA